MSNRNNVLLTWRILFLRFNSFQLAWIILKLLIITTYHHCLWIRRIILLHQILTKMNISLNKHQLHCYVHILHSWKLFLAWKRIFSAIPWMMILDVVFYMNVLETLVDNMLHHHLIAALVSIHAHNNLIVSYVLYNIDFLVLHALSISLCMILYELNEWMSLQLCVFQILYTCCSQTWHLSLPIYVVNLFVKTLAFLRNLLLHKINYPIVLCWTQARFWNKQNLIKLSAKCHVVRKPLVGITVVKIENVTTTRQIKHETQTIDLMILHMINVVTHPTISRIFRNVGKTVENATSGKTTTFQRTSRWSSMFFLFFLVLSIIFAMDPSRRQRRIFHTFSQGTSNFSTSAFQQPTTNTSPTSSIINNIQNNQQRNSNTTQEKRNRKSNTRKRFSFHTVYNTQEDWRSATSIESSSSQPIHTKETIQDRNNATRVSDDPTKGLVNEYRSAGRVFTHPSPQTISSLPPFFLEQTSLSVPHTLLWNVPITNGIYKDPQTSSTLGTKSRDTDIRIPGRSYPSSQIQRASPSTNSEVNRSSRVSYRNQDHEIVSTHQEITGSSTGGTKIVASSNNNNTPSVVIHR
ncbi:hypothetical protein BDA99DRAFT_478100 [Phascolomyces articulosus]|uniref:Uncharacterized protein n=1 Tax=Phascolomyces articulosus TaxID=60185 RepID=A0AAD5KIV3_9FUNG|nr:hypothetical protein BDA99DRAFT_478100 [Phascolomyces articulosus]